MGPDQQRIIWICTAFALGSGVAFYLVGPFALVLALTALLALVLGTLRDEMHRLTRRHNESFRQTEAAIALYAVVKPRLPLPAMRGWAISPDMAGLVYAMVMERKPRCIVELGSGVSSLVTGYALEQLGNGGQVLSLDHDERFSGETVKNLERHGLTPHVRVVHAPLRPLALDGETWDWYETTALEGVSEIDLLIVDGPIQAGNSREMVRFPALPVLRDRLAPDAVVLLDDTNRRHESAMVERWLALYPEFEGRFIATEAGTSILRRRPREAPAAAE